MATSLAKMSPWKAMEAFDYFDLLPEDLVILVFVVDITP